MDPSQSASSASSFESSDTADTDEVVDTEVEPLPSLLCNKNQPSVIASDFIGVDEAVITRPLDSSTALALLQGGEQDRDDGEKDDVRRSFSNVTYQTMTARLRNVSTFVMQRGGNDGKTRIIV